LTATAVIADGSSAVGSAEGEIVGERERLGGSEWTSLGEAVAEGTVDGCIIIYFRRRGK